MRRLAALAVGTLTIGLMSVPAVAAAPSAGTPSVGRQPVGPSSAGAAADRPVAGRFSSVVTPAAAAAGRERQLSVGPLTSAATVPGRPGAAGASSATAHVIVSGDPAAVSRQVAAMGGRVLAAANGQASVLLPRASLDALTHAPGVAGIAAPERPVTTGSGVTSQGVAASHADVWQSAGQSGSGVQVAIIDAGFGASQAEYDNEISAANLGSNTQLTNEDCVDSTGTASPYDDPHGLAVAEIVQQMAPGAQLFLYCVSSSLAVNTAVSDIESRGIRIISSSLVWPGDSRGDGTGPVNSVAAAVANARQHGILWVNSAGNDVPFHYGGTMRDTNHDGYLDIGNANPNTYPFESNFYTVAAGTPSAPSGAQFVLQWDQWPTSSLPIDLEAYGVQCMSAITPTPNGLDDCQGVYIDPDSKGNPIPVVSTLTPGSSPVLTVQTTGNTSPYPQIWEVASYSSGGFPAVHYDLTGYGTFAGPSDLSCPQATTNGTCIFAAAAQAYSVDVPANSPYAMAVGAASAGADPNGPAQGTLEYFSSQGPTIDGRVKPDITGWDDVSTNITEYPYFYGTSAAAPHVAGAAALVLGLHPGWDVAQVQNYLEQQAGNGAPTNPGSNVTGHGLLTLGAPGSSALPVGSGFTALPRPTRIVSNVPLGAAQATTLTMNPALVPGDATAVAVSLNAVNDSNVSTYLSAYPGGTTYPSVSNLNLPTTDRQAQAFAVVPLNQNAIQVRNAFGSVSLYVDLLGYFSPSSPGLYTPKTGIRLANTQGHPVPAGTSLTVSTQGSVPADATSVLVNLEAFDEAGAGYLTVSASGAPGTSNLAYLGYVRANLAVTAVTGTGTFQVAVNRAATDVLVDLVGYFGPTGSGFVPLAAPVRVVNTQWGNNAPPTPVGPASTITTRAIGYGDIPASATGLLADVLALESGGAPSYLTLFTGTVRPQVSTVAFSNGRPVSNAAVIQPDADGLYSIYNRFGATNVYVDAFGYFLPG